MLSILLAVARSLLHRAGTGARVMRYAEAHRFHRNMLLGQVGVQARQVSAQCLRC